MYDLSRQKVVFHLGPDYTESDIRRLLEPELEEMDRMGVFYKMRENPAGCMPTVSVNSYLVSGLDDVRYVIKNWVLSNGV